MSAKLIRIGDLGPVWGVVPALPLKEFPPGRVRLRLRNTDFAQAFVKTETGIRHFYVAEKDGFWIPRFEQGSNQRTEVPA